MPIGCFELTTFFFKLAIYLKWFLISYETFLLKLIYFLSTNSNIVRVIIYIYIKVW